MSSEIGPAVSSEIGPAVSMEIGPAVSARLSLEPEVVAGICAPDASGTQPGRTPAGRARLADAVKNDEGNSGWTIPPKGDLFCWSILPRENCWTPCTFGALTSVFTQGSPKTPAKLEVCI